MCFGQHEERVTVRHCSVVFTEYLRTSRCNLILSSGNSLTFRWLATSVSGGGLNTRTCPLCPCHPFSRSPKIIVSPYVHNLYSLLGDTTSRTVNKTHRYHFFIASTVATDTSDSCLLIHPCLQRNGTINGPSVKCVCTCIMHEPCANGLRTCPRIIDPRTIKPHARAQHGTPPGSFLGKQSDLLVIVS